MTIFAMTKIPGEKAVELSIELAPYIQAYIQYRDLCHTQSLGKEINPENLRNCKQAYQEARAELEDSLMEISAGCWADVVDMATDSDRLSQIFFPSAEEEAEINDVEKIKQSPAYHIMDDSFVEIVRNIVDETLAKHIATLKSDEPIKTLNAVLAIQIDDQSTPGSISISCVDNGRGFSSDFIKKVATPELRADFYAKLLPQLRSPAKSDTDNFSVFRSEKLSEQKSLSDIALFVGGAGRGLRELMLKVDTGLYDATSRKKYNKKQFRSPGSDIVLNNIQDNSGNILGAAITITTLMQPNQEDTRSLTIGAKEKLDNIKKGDTRESPLSVVTDFFDDEEPDVDKDTKSSPNSPR